MRGGWLAAGLVLAAGAAQADVKAGVEAWTRGDYAAAIAQWRPLADKGDADAEFNMGQAYKLGRGVTADQAAAERYYRQAAVQNHPQAQDNLAMQLIKDGRHADAVPWLEKAAARGEARAQLVLGTMLFNGDSVPRDPVRGYALVSRAAQAGVPQAAQPLQQIGATLTPDQRAQGEAMARAGGGVGLSAGAPPTVAPSVAPPPPKSVAVHVGTPAGAPVAVHVGGPPAKAPTPAKAPVVAARSAGNGWRLQLGAFGDAGNARALWGRLQGKVAALRPLAPAYVQVGNVTRLQAGPLGSSAEASRACAAVKAAGAACLPVAP